MLELVRMEGLMQFTEARLLEKPSVNTVCDLMISLYLKTHNFCEQIFFCVCGFVVHRVSIVQIQTRYRMFVELQTDVFLFSPLSSSDLLNYSDSFCDNGSLFQPNACTVIKGDECIHTCRFRDVVQWTPLTKDCIIRRILTFYPISKISILRCQWLL